MIKQVFVYDSTVHEETDCEYFRRLYREYKLRVQTLRKVDSLVDFLENTGRE